MAEDTSYIFHRSAEANVYLTQRNGLFYLPICAEPRTQTPLITTGVGSRGLGVEILVCIELDCLPGSYYFYFRDELARYFAR